MRGIGRERLEQGEMRGKERKGEKKRGGEKGKNVHEKIGRG